MDTGFIKYPKLKRLDDPEVNGLLEGRVHVFPKLDGTNGSLWMDSDTKEIKAGSRNRELNIEKDNRGFYSTFSKDKKFKDFFNRFAEMPLVLYGEFMVPHTFRDYKDEVWKNFYVFDVLDTSDYGFIPFTKYEPWLRESGINYIPRITTLNHPSQEEVENLVTKSTFMTKDSKPGEGVVIKRYDFVNRFGRTTWGKVTTPQFGEKKHTTARPKNNKEDEVVSLIVSKYVTKGRVDKMLAKVKNKHDGAWSSKYIPELLHRVYHDLVTEETWNVIMELKNPKLDFNKLKKATFEATKQHLPTVF